VVFMSLGQALGDGIAFFLFAPAMLLFLPYVMLNYQAMNVVPFLLSGKNKNVSFPGLKKYLLPVVSIVLIYLIGGIMIKIVGSFFGFS
ncbi:MAG: hypothetical protein NUV67_05845, partial [archaeon]|nr:hypothetical protein [archaeon]